jgi:hypothetical protein
LGAVYNNLGNALRQQGQLEEAEEAMRRALDIHRAQTSPNRTLVATFRYNIALVKMERGELAAAESDLRDIIETLVRLEGPHATELDGPRSTLGEVLQARGQSEEARAIWLDLLKVQRERDGAESLDAGLSAIRVADAYYEAGDRAGGLEYAEQAWTALQSGNAPAAERGRAAELLGRWLWADRRQRSRRGLVPAGDPAASVPSANSVTIRDRSAPPTPRPSILSRMVTDSTVGLELARRTRPARARPAEGGRPMVGPDPRGRRIAAEVARSADTFATGRTAGHQRTGRTSPGDARAVLSDRGVRRDNRQAAENGLADEEAIERVPVQRR